MRAVAVVGAGPVGLHLAGTLHREGFDTVLVEEHPEVGLPVNCAGLISRSGLQELGVEVGGALVNSIRGARLYSPGGVELTIERQETVAYVVDREKFDKGFYRSAKIDGLEIMFNSKVIDVNGKTLFLKHEGRGEMLKAKVVLGADGAVSKVREIMGVKPSEKEFVHAIQVRVRKGFDPDFVELHFGDFAGGFFGWVIPESGTMARVGIGTTSGNAKRDFEEFAKKIGLEDSEPADLSSALIPVGPPLKAAAAGNIALVGDAAFHTKATSGGGIVMGINAANVLAESVSEMLKGRGKLEDYNRRLKGLNRELETHWKVRSYLNSLGSKQLDSLFAKMKKAGIEEFLAREGDMDRPSRFVPKMLLKPKMWGFAPELVGLLKR